MPPEVVGAVRRQHPFLSVNLVMGRIAQCKQFMLLKGSYPMPFTGTFSEITQICRSARYGHRGESGRRYSCRELAGNTGNKLQPLNFHPRMNKKAKITRAQKKQRLRELKPSLVLARDVLQVARRKANNSTCRMGIAMLQDRLMDTSLCLRKRVCIMIIY